MRKLIQKIPKKKLTKLIQGRVFGDDIKQQLSIVKEMPEKYFTMDELVKHTKKKKSFDTEFRKMISKRIKEMAAHYC